MEPPKIRLYKGVFSVILIATVMTVFELVFYVVIVNPNIIIAISALLNSQASNELIDPRLEHILTTFNNREHVLINDINFGAYAIIIVEIFLMLALLSYVYMRIVNEHQKEDLNFRIRNLDSTLYASGLTLLILISFQVMFFYFGLDYYYMGRFGIDEVVVRFSEVYTRSNEVTK